MATLTFKAEEIHYEENYRWLFIEPYSSARTNKEREQGWTFELNDTLIEQVAFLCSNYHFTKLFLESLCMIKHMKDSLDERASHLSKEEWESNVSKHVKRMDNWYESSKFEAIFKTDNLDYIKVKQKDSPNLIKYEGILLDFIRQAVIEKVERDSELLNKIKLATIKTNWLIKNELKPLPSKEAEKGFAFYMTWFLRDQLASGLLDSVFVNKERIDEFGSELMKLAGVEFECDKAHIDSALSERRANFRTWRREYKKFLEENGLIP